ncbi:MAG TPA: sigma-70 family RNA polymerase sigma factor [Verrucomicrobiae bacterium]|nr:sigma-70 family RNA polymerase sigma factor [Verrucomicrobiae bacterium]
MAGTEYSDAQLVANTLAGDRDAFGRIVAKYQTLICSLAYSRLGNIGQSEDVAQDTFVVAWCHLRHLRDPEKLRAWLCGILRNRIQKYLHREGREPAHDAEPIELADHTPAPDPLPSEESVTREEEAILWKSLSKIPEIYREPLILFYREHQSITSVALQLDLTEDTVKQRLSRGRKLLQEEVATFVERTLDRTAPTGAFSAMVLAALPVVTGSAAATAGAATAAKGAGATKFGFLGAWLAPYLGIFSGLAVGWMSVRLAPTEAERRVKLRSLIALWGFILGWCFIAKPAVYALGRHYQWNDQTWVGVLAGFWWFYAAVVAGVIVVFFRRVLAVREQFEATGGASVPLADRKRLAVAVALHLACCWVAYLAWEAADRIWAAIIIAGMIPMAGWYLYQLRRKAGSVSMRASAKHMTLLCGLILLALNLRLDVWVAARRGVSVAEVHQFLPVWLIPLLSVALIAWVAALIAITKPKAKATSR